MRRIQNFKMILWVVLGCTLIAPSAIHGQDGYWRWVNTLHDTIQGPAKNYTGGAKIVDGGITLWESGEDYSLRGHLQWTWPSAKKLIVGDAIPYKYSYRKSGDTESSYGHLFYGFSGSQVYNREWLTRGASRNWAIDPSVVDGSVVLRNGRRSGEFKVPAKPQDSTYMYVVAGAVGYAKVQGFHIRLYEWIDGSVDQDLVRTTHVPCAEALGFYGVNELKGYYSGKGSLNYTRDDIANMFAKALLQYAKQGNPLADGTRTVKSSGEDVAGIPLPITDALDLARTFDTTGMPTGNENQLHTAIRALAESKRAKDPTARLTPGDVFYLSLRANRGNVRDALCTCHAALDRSTAANATLIKGYLVKLRNEEGYSDQPFEYTTERGTKRTTIPRKNMGRDEQGVWYHLFGMAAVEFTDGHNIAPFFATQSAVYARLPYTKTAKVQQRGFPSTGIGGQLGDFAIALEDASRHAGGSVPDPDKYCINYSGIAAGARLKRELRPYLEQQRRLELEARESGQLDPTSQTIRPYGNLTSIVDYRSPLSLRIEGSNGELFTFDQTTKRFGGNSPNVFILVNPDADGSWGLTVAPRFEVAKSTFTAVESAKVAISIYDHQTKTTRWEQIDVRRGQVIEGAVVGVDGESPSGDSPSAGTSEIAETPPTTDSKQPHPATSVLSAIGIEVLPLTGEVRALIGSGGAAIVRIGENSIGSRSSLRRGDMIIVVGEAEVKNPEHLEKLLARDWAAGKESVSLGVTRPDAGSSYRVKLALPPRGPSADDVSSAPPVTPPGLKAPPVKAPPVKAPPVKAPPVKQRPYVGVNVGDVLDPQSRQLGVHAQWGAVLTKIFDNSPAAKAGLRAGDVIYGCDGKRVANQAALTKMINASQPGRRHTIDVMRGRDTLRILLTLEAWPRQ